MKNIVKLLAFLILFSLAVQTPAVAASPWVGVWYSHTLPSQQRATVTVDASSNVFANFVDVATNQQVHLLTGTVNDRYLNSPVSWDHQAHATFSYVSADGSRMFIGIQDSVGNYIYSATFLRTP